MQSMYRMSIFLFLIVLLTPFNQIQASERSEQILASGKINVCIWPDYYMITYRNPRTKVLQGIDIDMAKALADHFGVELAFVESSFSKLVENLKNNTCDIAMHGVGVRDSRKPHMEFSQPYLSSGIYAVGIKENDRIQQWSDIDQHGNVAVVQKGTYMEPVTKAAFKKAEVAVVDSFKAREQEVMSGRADVFMTDYPYGTRMAKLTDWAILLSPEQPFAKTDYAYAVPKGEMDWLEDVNAFVTEMKANGQLAKFAEKNGLSEIVVLD